jgi:hypothetical protein
MKAQRILLALVDLLDALEADREPAQQCQERTAYDLTTEVLERLRRRGRPQW